MKCDELESYGMDDPAIGEEYEMYKVADVDAAIAELNAKLAEKDKDIAYWREEYDKETKLTDALEAEIESLKASHYAEMVDAGMRERRLRRALWVTRALRARDKAFEYHFKNNVEMCAKWDNVHLMLMAKAEEYK